MNSAKWLKKIDPRVVQGLVMLIIAVLFLYVCYSLYTEFSAYSSAKHREPSGVVDAAGVQAPQFHQFIPRKEELHRYQLFTFPDKRTAPPQSTANGTDKQTPQAARSSDYTLLGVVKKDRFYLVVRFNDGSVSLTGAGQTIIDRTRVKSVTADHAVIVGPGGKEKVYRVFQIELQKFKESSRKSNES